MDLDRLLGELDIEVELFATCEVANGWRLHLPKPPATMVHFVLRGSGRVTVLGGESHDFCPQHLGVIPKETEHVLAVGAADHDVVVPVSPARGEVPHIVAGETGELQVACGLVSLQYGTLGLFDHLHDALIVDLSKSPRMTGVFETLLDEQSNPGAGSSALTAALMQQCLVQVFRVLHEDPDSSLPWLSALSDPRLSAVIDRVVRDPGADHTVESLASVAALSRSAFAKRFTDVVGVSPMALVRRVRLDRAAHRLLTDREASMEQVASSVGFSSRSQFSKAFRVQHGVSPSAWRTQRAGDVGA